MCSSSNDPIKVLNLAIRSYNCLRRAGLNTVAQVAALSDEDLLSIRNLGRGALIDIRQKLAVYLAEHPLPEAEEESHGEEASCLADSTLVAALQVRDISLDDVPLERLGLPQVRFAVLWIEGIRTVGQLAMYSDEFRRTGYFGRWLEALDQVRDTLNHYLTSLLPADHPSRQSIRTKPLPSKALAEVQEESTEPETAVLSPSQLHPLPSDSIPLDMLGLSTHSYSSLRRVGITTIGQLAAMSREQILEVRSVGEKALAEIEAKMKAYWADPSSFKVPAVARKPPAVPPASPASGSEVPRTPAGELTLSEQMTRWLSGLTNRQQQVIRWRYGLDGDKLTLEEAGEQLGVTRERVRQIQNKALRALKKPQPRTVIRPLRALLVCFLEQAGGLMNEAQIVDALQRELITGNIGPAGAVRPVFDLDDDFKWLRKAQAWGLTSCPLTQVPDINKRLSRVLKKAYAPISFDKVITRFKATRYYLNHRDELDDTFIAACLRTHPQIVVDGDGMCGLKKWAKRKLDEVVLTLRQIGYPVHYSIIAEQANALLPQDQQTSARNIHAILDRYPDIFINVGRGKYWLQSHLREEISTQSQADFGDLFGVRLERWQKDWDRRQGNVESDTQAEVDTIRRIGLEFFND